MPVDVDELTVDAEQLLDDALGLLVAAFAEVVVSDDALRVYEVERLTGALLSKALQSLSTATG